MTALLRLRPSFGSRKDFVGFFAAVLLLAAPLGAPLLAQQVSALGRIQPLNGVINVWGPDGVQIEKILVEQGDWVEKGDLLVELSSQERLHMEVRQAEMSLAHAQESLDAERTTQAVRIYGMQSEYESALARLEQIRKNQDIVNPQSLEERESAVLSAKNALELAGASRDLILLKLAQAVTQAEMAVEKARASAEAGLIRAPARGKILMVRHHPGDTLGRMELIKIADTSRMAISTEVYESDIHRVQVGQKAQIRSSALQQPLSGTVIQKGHMIFRQTVDSLDPRALSNSRVIEVIVELEDSRPAESLVYLQVDVLIQL